MRALCVLALILLATGAEPNVGPVVRALRQPQTLPEPSSSQRRLTPGPEFKKIKSEKWLDEADKHRPGDTDDSARTVAALSPETLAGIISGFEWGVVRIADPPTKIQIMKRAVVLHTDIATFATHLNEDVVNNAAQMSLRKGAALELVDALKREHQCQPQDLSVFAR
jgi:hypothetical protein